MCAKDDDGVGSAYGELFKFPECGDTLFQLQLQPIDEGIATGTAAMSKIPARGISAE